MIIGEIDNASLSVLALKTYSDKSIVAPRNAMEAQIEAVWREQLGVYVYMYVCICANIYTHIKLYVFYACM
jgi:hypothetical protein